MSGSEDGAELEMRTKTWQKKHWELKSITVEESTVTEVWLKKRPRAEAAGSADAGASVSRSRKGVWPGGKCNLTPAGHTMDLTGSSATDAGGGPIIGQKAEQPDHKEGQRERRKRRRTEDRQPESSQDGQSDSSQDPTHDQKKGQVTNVLEGSQQELSPKRDKKEGQPNTSWGNVFK